MCRREWKRSENVQNFNEMTGVKFRQWPKMEDAPVIWENKVSRQPLSERKLKELIKLLSFNFSRHKKKVLEIYALIYI